jgi:purine-binding chemotaxis protein CheW
MATTTPPTTRAAGAPSEQQLVVFSLHDEHYALPITSVREIIRYRPPRGIAAANPLIQGVISLRGHIIPVCDLSGQLGEPLQITDGTKILIVEAGDAVIGLLVDAVDEVLSITSDQIEPMPVTDNDLGDQIAKIDERLIVLIDTDRAFSSVLAS